MATPSWFNEADYLASKLAQLKAVGLGDRWTNTDQVKATLDAAGITAYDHFSDYHLTEGTSPNKLFNAYEYLTAKAASLNAAGVDSGQGSPWTIQLVDAAFKTIGLSAWQHFQQFGWKEGVNPSNSFDVAAYLNAKVAQLQQAIPGETWTVEKVTAAFEANGFDPITHYEAAGKAEGVPAAAVAANQRVEDDPREAGEQYVLTTSQSETIIGTPQNETVVADSVQALQNGHLLYDQTETDRDVIKVTATEAVKLSDGGSNKSLVSGFEVLEVTWKDYADASVDLEDFVGLKEFHLTVDQVGNLGNATIKNVENQQIVLGAGVTGTVEVTSEDGISDAGGTIFTGLAKAVSFDTDLDSGGSTVSTATATVVGGAEVTVIHVSQDIGQHVFDTSVVKAGAKTTEIAAAGRSVHVTTSAATQKVEAKVGVAAGQGVIVVDATSAKAGAQIKLVGATTTVSDTVTVKLGDNAELTLQDLGGPSNSNDKLTLDVAAGKTVDLVGSTVLDRASETVVAGAGDVTLQATSGLLHEAKVTKANAGVLAVSVKNTVTNTTNVRDVAADQFTLTAGVGADLWVKASQQFDVAASDASATLRMLVASDDTNKQANVKLTSTEYTSVTTSGVETLNLTAGHEAGLTINTLNVDVNKAVLAGASDVTLKAATFKTLDASNVTGKLVVGSTSAVVSGTVLGAQGDTSVVFSLSPNGGDANFTGLAGNDSVKVTSIGSHRAILVMGEGDNSVEVGQSTGVLNVVAGGGNDTVALTGAVAGSTVVLNLGGGTNTLKLAGVDLSAAASTVINGVNVIEVNIGLDNKIAAKDVSGKAIHVKGSVGNARLSVEGSDSADTIDLSGFTVSNSVGSNAQITVNGKDGNDVITGTSAADIINGGAGNDTINGGAGDDVITGGAGADTLTGGAGNDTFVYTNLGESLLSGFDKITDFVIGSDTIRSKLVAAADVKNLGAVTTLDASGIAALLTTVNFVSNGAATFTFVDAGATRTFVAINDGADGYADASDAVIEITGYTGTLSELGIAA